jgi:hypothetical protein
MITYTTGSLLAANAQALVNTVNTEGVMARASRCISNNALQKTMLPIAPHVRTAPCA